MLNVSDWYSSQPHCAFLACHYICKESTLSGALYPECASLRLTALAYGKLLKGTPKFRNPVSSTTVSRGDKVVPSQEHNISPREKHGFIRPLARV
jgi:hypothetical protein